MSDIDKLWESMKNPPELHEDLKPHLHLSDNGFQILQHPLVYSVPYNKAMNLHLNESYVCKTKYIEECMETEEFNGYVFSHERPYRIEAFMDIENLLPDKDFWELLANVYTDSENTWQYQNNLTELMQYDLEDTEFFMSNEERDFFNNLPETLTVYRGYIEENTKFNMSWTLSEKVATWFSNRLSKGGKTISMKINKKDIFAYKNGRNEEEIIILNSESKYTP